MTENASKLSQKLISISMALDKIKSVSRAPEGKFTMTSIHAICYEAFDLTVGGLNEYGIRPNVKGPDIQAEVNPDKLRHAFVQLIINSIEAFKERRQKGGRAIWITVDPLSTSTKDFKIRFSDNATGIDPSKLRFPPGFDSNRPLKDLLFNPGVTSKAEGSGVGLYLVRKLIGQHNGSIELVDSRNGVVFDITLPKHQTILRGPGKTFGSVKEII